MKLVRERFIHNRLQFDEAEKDTLISAHKIISKVRDVNARGYTEDVYLRDLCTQVLDGISELADNYNNKYEGEIKDDLQRNL